MSGDARAARVWFFAVLACGNAALLFTVEPMVARLALPLLGGTPSVWNTALVCFQLFLLLGYLYAYGLTRWIPPARQLWVHAGVILVSLLSLPVHMTVVGHIPTGTVAVPWLALLFARTIGVPFIVLASSAPLLQAWMVQGRDDTDVNPYPLYAASNLGSFMALLAYPAVVEPVFALTTQRIGWSAAYAGVLSTLVLGGWMARRHATQGVFASAAVSRSALPLEAPRPVSAQTSPRRCRRTDIGWRERWWWVLGAAVPSSLLLGVTAKLSTDVAAIPLLWVVPLALYLLTFVLVFASRPLVPHGAMVRLEPFVLIPVLLMDGWGSTLPGLVPLVLHCAVLFVVSMVCHGELAKRRPSAKHLTEFYLWLSVGGVIGGAFTALVAPQVFTSVLEYPLMLAVAGMVRPSIGTSPRDRWMDVLIPCLVGGLLLSGRLFPYAASDVGPVPVPQVITAALASLVLLGAADRRARFAGGLFALIVASWVPTARASADPVVAAARSYFGVYRVRWSARDSVFELVHGTTVHGAQSIRAAQRLAPRTYYHRLGPMGDVFAATRAAQRPQRRVGIVGLGVGSLTCYGTDGELWTVFEIDPVVVALARDTRWFSFLRDCPPTVRMVVGDARQTLPTVGPAAFDMLVLDAFSSDAIPVHLLTREAFAGYANALAPGGVLAVHISNRHLDLEPVVAALARDGGWTARIRRDLGHASTAMGSGQSSSMWVALARRSEDLGGLNADTRWEPLRPPGPLWSDEYSNVLGVMRWR